MQNEAKNMNVFSRLAKKSTVKLLRNIPDTEDVIVRLKNPEDYLIGNIESVNGKNFTFLSECGENVVFQPDRIVIPVKRLAGIKRRPRAFTSQNLPPGEPGMF